MVVTVVSVVTKGKMVVTVVTAFLFFPNRFESKPDYAPFTANLAQLTITQAKARFESSKEPVPVHGAYIVVIAPLFERFENSVFCFIASGIQFTALLEKVLYWVQAFRVIAGSFLRSRAALWYGFFAQKIAQAIDHKPENTLGFTPQSVCKMDVDLFDS